MIKYSVVIPMYNAAETITASLDSILAQSVFAKIEEIIIVDDGSTDDSTSVVDQYIKDKKIKNLSLIKKENGGAASARNVGIRLANSDWIALLDSDDVWLPNKLELQDRVLSKNPMMLSLGSNRVGETIHRGTKITKEIYKLSPYEYCVKNWPCTPSIVFNRKIFSKDYYFDESLRHAEEGSFFLDIAYKSGLYYHIEELVLCGDGKRSFGESGLSGNIKEMHHGVKKMMSTARKKGYITGVQLLFLTMYENMKYVRRRTLIYIANRQNERSEQNEKD